MHFPFYITIGGQHILLHVITEILAFFIGYRYYAWLKKRQADTISSDHRLYIIVGAAMGALVGSRLLGGFEDPIALMHSSNKLLYFYMNKTIVGGFVGGWIGVEAMKKIIGEQQKSGDLFVYPILLALIIGRIGCFSMGVHEETYGLPTHSVFGMDLGDGIKRHPAALYEILFLILLWCFIKLVNKRFALAQGAAFKIFMIAYLLFRFLLDFIKPHYTWPIGLSSIQIACLLGLLYYIRFIVQPKRLLSNYAGTSIHLL